MCTFRKSHGFTIVEVLVALVLAVVLATAGGLLFLALTSRASAESDAVVSYLQGRVAVGRLERDLRLASAGGCLFATAGPILEASPSQIVFLRRHAGFEAPILVEWEIVSGALMRRWGTCPASRPTTFAHSLYRDNKTMLAGVKKSRGFSYLMENGTTVSQVSEAELLLVKSVQLDLQLSAGNLPGPVGVKAEARVGR